MKNISKKAVNVSICSIKEMEKVRKLLEDNGYTVLDSSSKKEGIKQMNYSGEFYCQYANTYVDCKNKKCSECEHYKNPKFQKSKKEN